MNKEAAYSVVTMILIVGGVALDWQSFRRLPREVIEDRQRLPTAAVPQPPPATSPEQLTKSIDPTNPASPSKDRQLVLAGFASRTDKSVIGSQFPMSASVDAGCKSVTLSGRGAICDRLRHDLSVMAHEPRDEAWAADIEAKLQNLIDSQISDDLSIRNVECRTTYCALELAQIRSSSGKYTFIGGYLPYGTPVYDQITWTGGSGVGTEIDPSGEAITVSLFTYRRIQ